MTCNVIIGNAHVRIDGAEHLTGPLSGLTRLPSHEKRCGTTIRVEPCSVCDWPFDITEGDGVHCFGRRSYALYVRPDSRQIRLRLLAQPDANELYWIQRDVFGVLACMSGELMLHSSATIAVDGRAWVFCGLSGTGKSTICRLLMTKGHRMISDEINWLSLHEATAVRRDNRDGEQPSVSPIQIVNQRFWFAGEEEAFLPVTRICLLQQSPRCALSLPPAKSEVFARLLAAHFSIDTRHDFLRERSEALLRLLEMDIVRTLAFNLDADELHDLLWTNTPPRES